jgi:hypothetical protein
MSAEGRQFSFTLPPSPGVEMGFRAWAATRFKARTAAAARLARHIAQDPAADRITSAEGLRLWLRWGPRMPAHVRNEASALWRGYAEFRRAREGR